MGASWSHVCHIQEEQVRACGCACCDSLLIFFWCRFVLLVFVAIQSYPPRAMFFGRLI
eukprot:m.16142 g.16142  ORF g.16142 m.16142 type:complete len:58 (+) comp6938_c0_seq1:372-545(+)